MNDTEIQWADKTWNPVTGCTAVSAGCKNCWAPKLMKRFAANWIFKSETRARYAASFDPKLGPVSLWPERLNQPLKWRKPQTVFVVSQGDLFHDDVPFEFILRVFSVMRRLRDLRLPAHRFLVLTKRPARMAEFVEWYRRYIFGEHYVGATLGQNVWLGVSVEDQKTADERIPILLSIPAAHRWLSIEPMLEAIHLEHGYAGYLSGWEAEQGHGHDCDPETGCDGSVCPELYQVQTPSIDWVVCGGESGSGARPMHPDWARKVRDDCKAAGVPFMFKQWGEWFPHPYGDWEEDHKRNVEGVSMWRHRRLAKVSGEDEHRLLDGVVHDGRPGQ